MSNIFKNEKKNEFIILFSRHQTFKNKVQNIKTIVSTLKPSTFIIFYKTFYFKVFKVNSKL